MKAQKKAINLYWVTTYDKCEDWFVLATTRRAAASFHERYEGYNTHDASTRLVVANVDLTKYVGPRPRHAQIEDLAALGFEIVDDYPHQRVVRFKGETFVEGFMQAVIVEAHDNQAEAVGQGRPNQTRRSSPRRN